MKATLTQSGAGLSLFQGGLGPVVQLGFGASGAAANLATAPVVTDVQTGDMILVQRRGALTQVPEGVFQAGQASVAASLAVAAVSEQLVSINGEIAAQGGSITSLGAEVASQSTSLSALAASALQGITAQATALPAGANPTAVFTPGPNNAGVLSLGVPAGSAGAPGAVSTVPSTGFVATFNPATNVTSNGLTLAAGAAGLQPNTWFYATSAGASSIFGTSTAIAIGDYALVNATATAFLYIPGSVFAQAATGFLVPNNAHPTLGITDNGDGTAALAVTDGAGNVHSQFSGIGFQTYAAIITQATIGALTVAGNLAASSVSASGTVAASALVAQTTAGAGLYLVENGDGSKGLAVIDLAGNVHSQFTGAGFATYAATITQATIGTLSLLGNLVAPTVTTPVLAVGLALQLADNGDGQPILVIADPGGNVAGQLDGTSGLSVGLLTVANLVVTGTMNAPGTSGGTLTFSETDIAALDTAALAFGAGERAPTDTTSQAPNLNYNGVLTLGQSHAVGEEGSDVINTTQPFDNLSIGAGERGFFNQYPVPSSAAAIWAPIDPSGADAPQAVPAFQPAVSVIQSIIGSAPAWVPPKGALTNVQGVSVATTSTSVAGTTTYSGVISWTDATQPAATTIFTAGQATPSEANQVDLGGFVAPVATINSDGITSFPIVAVTANSITVAANLGNTTTPQNDITINAVSFSRTYGEGHSTSAVNQRRAAQIGSLRANPANRFVVGNAAVSGFSITQLDPAGSPEYFLRALSFANVLNSTAKATSATATSGITDVIWSQGGNDLYIVKNGTVESAGLTTEDYLADLVSIQTSINAFNAANGLRSPRYWLVPPPIEATPSVDFSQSGEPMPILTAHARAAGLCADLYPGTGSQRGYGLPMIDGTYLAGPLVGQQPDRGPHFFGMGYVQAGCMIGRAQAFVDLGFTWRPLHPIGWKIRGKQVIVEFSVPVPPIQWLNTWFKTSLLPLPQKGFCVTDDAAPTPASGGVPFASIQIVGSATVEIMLSRTPVLNTSPAPIGWIGDAGLNSGRVMLGDSDTTRSYLTYSAGVGTGQALIEQSFAANGSYLPLNNRCIQRAMAILPG